MGLNTHIHMFLTGSPAPLLSYPSSGSGSSSSSSSTSHLASPQVGRPLYCEFVKESLFVKVVKYSTLKVCLFLCNLTWFIFNSLSIPMERCTNFNWKRAVPLHRSPLPSCWKKYPIKAVRAPHHAQRNTSWCLPSFPVRHLIL